MSSETSTDVHTFRPWHLFVLVGLLASTAAVLVLRPGDPVVLVLLVLTMGSAAGVGLAVYRMISPLAGRDLVEAAPDVGGRPRAALEREKTYLLRAIKELEFDRAMGKVSDADFDDVGSRLRTQALAVMKQLDTDIGYRDVIARELASRLGIDIGQIDLDTIQSRPAPAASTPDAASPADPGPQRPVCPACETENETDARFCKSCGSPLEAGA